MSLRKLSLIVALLSAVLAPLAATASDGVRYGVGDVVYHPYQPAHEPSTKSRAEVLAEAEAARKMGSLTLGQGDVVIPGLQQAAVAGPGRTREAVREEAISVARSGQLSRGDVFFIY